MEQSGEWGGQLECAALSAQLGCPITVHLAGEAPVRLGAGESGPCLQLSYHRRQFVLGAHYNSVTAGAPRERGEGGAEEGAGEGEGGAGWQTV